MLALPANGDADASPVTNTILMAFSDWMGSIINKVESHDEKGGGSIISFIKDLDV